MKAVRHARGLLDLALAFVLYGLIAVAVSWPLARDFSTWLLGDVPYDQRHTIWILWHTKEALLGRQPLFGVDLLYYPHGISTLVDGVGPVSGLLALPFWWLPSSSASNGAVAAYNGATWLGFALSGLCMYALARFGVKTDRFVAFFAGLLFMMWPSHLVSLYGHLEKAFVGLLPLNVLAATLAYDPARSRGWLIAPGVTLLAILLHNANQFTFAILAIMLIAAAGFITRVMHERSEHERGEGGEHRRVGDAGGWRPYATRVVIAGILAIVVTGPLLVALYRITREPNMDVRMGVHAAYYSPDLLQLIVPSIHQAVGGRLMYPEYHNVVFDFTRMSILESLTARKGWYGSGIETAVTIPIVAMVLMLFGVRGRTKRADPDADMMPRPGVWLLMGAAFSILALGPVLRVAGLQTIPLPFRILVKIPGFDVMRTPGRFMMIASVGFALAAALGLAALMARAPNRRRATIVAALATLIVLVECWPRVWLQHVPLPVPDFYTRIAQDDDRFAVLDLPAGRWSMDKASAYMYYQMTHGRPIAWGYLSRQFIKYPIPGVTGILDEANAPDALATRQRLAQLGYRYVVWHKHATELFGTRRPENTSDRFQSPPAEAQSYPFLREAFANDRPVVDDDMVTVYRIDPGAPSDPGGK